MAEKYQCVVRLKGGDPAIFGRVTEEINTLKSYGIEHEIIPGVTSASCSGFSQYRINYERNSA